MSELTNKLINVQKGLVVPKSNFNSFGKYKYRSAEDILEAVKPLNAEQGLLLTLSDEPTLIGDRHYIKATATITDGTDSHVVTAYARESAVKKGMDDSQITGTASSYARKYALNGLYLIDDTKDADTDEYQKQANRGTPTNDNKKTTVTQITAAQVGIIKTKALEYAKARNGSVDKLYKALNITDLEKLSGTQAVSAIKQLDAWLAEIKK